VAIRSLGFPQEFRVGRGVIVIVCPFVCSVFLKVLPLDFALWLPRLAIHTLTLPQDFRVAFRVAVPPFGHPIAQDCCVAALSFDLCLALCCAQ